MSPLRHGFLALLLAAPVAAAGTLRVDDSAVGLAHGGDWANAIPSLRDALTLAQPGDDLWVAEGVYRPDFGSGAVPGDRKATFQLKTGVRLFGGFAGHETTLAQRAGLFATTVLSGDLNGDDTPTGGFSENSVHVLTGSGVASSGGLDGFTITGGNANLPSVISGGGLWIEDGSPTFRRCTFRANRCHDDGGAATVLAQSAPAFVECAFVDNFAGDVGGAIWSSGKATPTFLNCDFIGNASGRLGGAIYQFLSTNASVTVMGCLFSGNETVERGGAIFVSFGGTNIVGSTFANNLAGMSAGGVKTLSPTRFTGCVLWGNRAPQGTTQNQQLGGEFDPAVINRCCVEGWTGTIAGVSNFGLDPGFVDADGPDGLPGTLDDDLTLGPASPCIDSGDNAAFPADTFDLDGDGNLLEPLPLDGASTARFQDDPSVADAGAGVAPIVDRGARERGVDQGVLVYGSGCPGTGGFTPTLGWSGAPVAQNPVVLSIGQALGGSTAVVLLGLAQAAVPVGGGCTLNVTPVLPLQLVIPLGGNGAGNGFAILPVVVPAGVTGAVLTMQAFVADASTPTGFSTTKGLEITFQ